MAAVGFGWATGQSVRYLRGGGIHYTYNLAVGEGKGVARAHKTKQAGGGAEGGGGYTYSLAGGEGKGVARENTGLNTHRKGGGGRSRASTQYICTNRAPFLFGFTAF